MSKMKLAGSCVQMGGMLDEHARMCADAVDVSYRTFRRNVEGLDEWALERGYVVRGLDLKLKDDWHVGFYRSVLWGRTCWFLRWSAYEFVWTLDGQLEPPRQFDDFRIVYVPGRVLSL